MPITIRFNPNQRAPSAPKANTGAAAKRALKDLAFQASTLKPDFAHRAATSAAQVTIKALQEIDPKSAHGKQLVKALNEHIQKTYPRFTPRPASQQDPYESSRPAPKDRSMALALTMVKEHLVTTGTMARWSEAGLAWPKERW